MERLKKQDEERKKRKKEEKERKDREKEMERKYEEHLRQKREEERQRKLEIEEQKKEEELKLKKREEENARRKKNFESSIKKLWNGSDVPCLFDPKIAYSNLLYSIPVELEKKICNNEIDYQDIAFRRYKTLIFPLDDLLSSEA